ncbi:MAG: hypothetical protein NT178_15270 [Proteobacteria bacterium]|nr:hypothetical protein [Pseudomonadota bacterium]
MESGKAVKPRKRGQAPFSLPDSHMHDRSLCESGKEKTRESNGNKTMKQKPLTIPTGGREVPA